jgi:hypothetical protein
VNKGSSSAHCSITKDDILSFQRTCELLLTTVLRDWLGCFSSNEIIESFDIFFHPKEICSTLTFPCLVHYLCKKQDSLFIDSTASKERDHHAITIKEKRLYTQKYVHLLHLYMKECKVVGHIFYNLLPHEEIDNTASGSISILTTWRNVLRIPDIVSKVLQLDTPLWLSNDTYHETINEQLMSSSLTLRCLMNPTTTAAPTTTINDINIISKLIITMCRIGGIEKVALSWLHMMVTISNRSEESEEEKEEAKNITCNHGILIRSLPIDIIESIIVYTIKNIKENESTLIAWFADAVHWYDDNHTHQQYQPLYNVFTKRLLLHYEFQNINIITASLTNVMNAMKNRKKEENNILNTLCGVWCDHEFITSTNYTRQVYVTSLIIELLELFMNEEEEEEEDCSNSSSGGEKKKKPSHRLEESGCLNYLLSGVYILLCLFFVFSFFSFCSTSSL